MGPVLREQLRLGNPTLNKQTAIALPLAAWPCGESEGPIHHDTKKISPEVVSRESVDSLITLKRRVVDISRT